MTACWRIAGVSRPGPFFPSAANLPHGFRRAGGSNELPFGLLMRTDLCHVQARVNPMRRLRASFSILALLALHASLSPAQTMQVAATTVIAKGESGRQVRSLIGSTSRAASRVAVRLSWSARATAEKRGQRRPL